jgi:hypothetical protein
MQLEIKIVIDFGEDFDKSAEMNDAMRFANERLSTQFLSPVCTHFGAQATTHMGWTSSGDDEPDEE